MVRRRDARLEAHPVADGTGAIKSNNGLMSSCQAPAAPLASPSSVSPIRHTLNFFCICQRRLHRQCLPWSVWAPFFTSRAAIGGDCLGEAEGREKPCKSLPNRCRFASQLLKTKTCSHCFSPSLHTKIYSWLLSCMDLHEKCLK